MTKKIDIMVMILVITQMNVLSEKHRNDNLIPYPESLALAAVVPEAHARMFLIQRVLGHVDLSVSNLLSWRFWREAGA